jgi:protein arginine N-methyltransferase 1
MMYSLDEYGEMIADRVRLSAYWEAISGAVKPGDAVADIGCGSGIFALLACRAGARRVYAIELDAIVETARQLAAANGFADQIVFLRQDSRRLELPERVQVIVSDVRGVLPFFDGAIASLEDARTRFLAPGGIMIPQQDTVFAAVIEAPAAYARITAPWSRNVHGLDLSSIREPLLHASHKTRGRREQLLTEPRAWCLLDYAGGANARAAATLHFRASRAGVAHGLCIWFETRLWNGIGYSTGPGNEQMIYGHEFLPWLREVSLDEGQEVSVELHADPVGADYIWRWNTVIAGNAAEKERRFEQSSFLGATFIRDALRRQARDFVPVLSESGEADRWFLNAMNGQQPLEEIARAGRERFPKLFGNVEDALRRVMALAEMYAR